MSQKLAKEDDEQPSPFESGEEATPIQLDALEKPDFFGIEPNGNTADIEDVPLFTGVIIMVISLYFTFSVFFLDMDDPNTLRIF